MDDVASCLVAGSEEVLVAILRAAASGAEGHWFEASGASSLGGKHYRVPRSLATNLSPFAFEECADSLEEQCYSYPSMRIILNRKGFDSGSGGCPSPIFSDGSMIAIPLPYEPSPIKYEELRWRGRELGIIVEAITNGRVLRTAGAHLDPDLRVKMRPRLPGSKLSLGQHKIAQGHLKRHGVAVGDLFLFWGLFRPFNERNAWAGERRHVIWGWLQVGEVVSVDDTIQPGLARGEWRWAAGHPHLAFKRDRSNTLYVAAKKLDLPGEGIRGLPGAGAFDFDAADRQLTTVGARTPRNWSLPLWFLPERRPPLSYHRNPNGGRFKVTELRVRRQAEDKNSSWIRLSIQKRLLGPRAFLAVPVEQPEAYGLSD